MTRTVNPAKVLPINVTSISPAAKTFTTATDWPTNTDAWDIVMSVTQMPHSAMHLGTIPGFWSGMDVHVGDWLTTQASGRSVQILSIASQTASRVTCRVVDKYRMNTLNDQTQNGDGSIQRGRGFLYEVKNAMPILYPLPDAFPGTISTMMAAQLLSRAFQVGGETGYNGTGGIQADSAVSLTQPLGTGGTGTGTGSSTFVGLSDAPHTFSNNRGKILRVNIQETALEFVSPSAGGGSPNLQTPTTGSYNDGAIKGWIPEFTTLADAFYQVNQFLNYFVPNGPPDLSHITMVASDAIYSVNGHNTLAAANIPSNCIYQLDFGTHVPFTGSDTINITATGFGYNNQGFLIAKLNGVVIGNFDDLSVKINNIGAVNGAITITNCYTYPVNDPISTYLALDVALQVTGYHQGLNEITLTTLTGTSVFNFVYDTDITAGTISNTHVFVNAYNRLFYSSGVPHLTSASDLTMTSTLSSWCSLGFVDHGIFIIKYLPHLLSDLNTVLAPEIDMGQGQYGIGATFGVSAPDITLQNIPIDLSAEVFGVFLIVFQTLKPLVSSQAHQYGPKLLVANGSPNNCIIESGWTRNGILMKRILIADPSQYPDMTHFTSDTASGLLWNPGNSTSWGSCAVLYQAPVIGGMIMATQDNFSVGYEPFNGPNFQGKPDAQVFDFSFHVVLSEFSLIIGGDRPDGIQLCLP